MDSTGTAKALLETLRRTPMLRGGKFTRDKRRLRIRISRAIERQGVLQRLAQRIALQFVWKFGVPDLGDHTVWRATGQLLQQETERLRNHVGLVDRQIIVALPKLSAQQIEDFLDELRASEPTVARTILNVALDAAEPLSAGRRYLAEYRRVVEHLKTIDPGTARTLANATFMAHMPRKKATHHFKTFSELVMKFEDDVSFARTVARAAFRAPDPIKAARRFITDYDSVVADLLSQGVESRIARSLAGIAGMGADPIPTGRKLLKNFEGVLELVKRTHPSVARSIALSACRATDPLTAARSYMKNYDTIVRLISRTDPHRAREVATQAFRSDNPLRWAKRYLAELQQLRCALS
jgi:hypothetical protein